MKNCNGQLTSINYLCLLFMCNAMHNERCTCVLTHTEARAGHQMSASTTLHLISSRQGLTKPNTCLWTKLLSSRLWALPISTSSTVEVTDLDSYLFMWVETTEVLTLESRCSYLLNHLPSHDMPIYSNLALPDRLTIATNSSEDKGDLVCL